MRLLRVLRQGVWYEIRTGVNNREPLFRRYTALAIFAKVFRETERRFVFVIRGLRLEDDWLRFYIKPADGLDLPAIMKWMKQVFAQRYNREDGRTGHIWGDRYGSRILEGEPPRGEEGEVAEGRGTSNPGVRPCSLAVRPYCGERAAETVFARIFPFPAVPAPG
jgi:REP element-mobilizing transposase RayT